MSAAALIMMQNAAMMNRQRYYGRNRGGGDLNGSDKAFILFLISFIVAVFVGFTILIVSVVQNERAKMARMEAFCAANGGQVQVMAVASQTKPQGKTTASEVVVEVKGVKTGEEVIVRERENHVTFSHIPVIGQRWKLYVKGGYLYMDRLE